jgi:hypothetical protein
LHLSVVLRSVEKQRLMAAYGTVYLLCELNILLANYQMCSILCIEEEATVRDILEVLCGATEQVISRPRQQRSLTFRFADLRPRPGEQAVSSSIQAD